MRLGNIIFILLLVINSSAGHSQDRTVSPVDFYREEVTLAVYDSSAFVSGIYYFCNNSERDSRMPIVFPFYVDSMSLYPDSIKAYQVNGNDTTYLAFRTDPEQKSILLGIPLSPKEVTVWHLDYRQKILSPKATYILTSTASWEKPLEDATYRFIVSSRYIDVRTWPEPDTMFEDGNTRQYLAHRIDFMPNQNMVIEWKLK